VENIKRRQITVSMLAAVKRYNKVISLASIAVFFLIIIILFFKPFKSPEPPWAFEGAYTEYVYPNNMSIRFEIINVSNNVFYYKTVTYNNSLPLKIEIKGPFNISDGKFPFISPINPARTIIRAFTYKPHESEYIIIKPLKVKIEFNGTGNIVTHIGKRLCDVYIVHARTIIVNKVTNNVKIINQTITVYIDKVLNIAVKIISTSFIDDHVETMALELTRTNIIAFN